MWTHISGRGLLRCADKPGIKAAIEHVASIFYLMLRYVRVNGQSIMRCCVYLGHPFFDVFAVYLQAASKKRGVPYAPVDPNSFAFQNGAEEVGSLLEEKVYDFFSKSHEK